MAQIINGKQFAAQLLTKIKSQTATLVKEKNIQPGIAVIIVGNDHASQIYVTSKGKRARECGFHSVEYKLEENTSENELIALINDLNKDNTIHGILVQLPLPRHIQKDQVCQTISPMKDVDGFHYINIGKVVTGNLDYAFVPCTPAGASMMIERYRGNDLSGLDAVVVGRSNIVGKPMANLLLAANATVTTAHSRTHDLDEVCRSADILVAAVGQPNLIKGKWIKPGATVIDVGINSLPPIEHDNGKRRLTGDVDFDEAEKIAGAITPVPGGVGPMTIAMLMNNTLKAAYLSIGLKPPKL